MKIRQLITTSIIILVLILGGCNSGGSSIGLPDPGPLYTIGGSVSGLDGTVILRNSGGNDLTITTNGPFAFSTALANNAAYNVTVQTQPAGQTCTVAGGTGNVGGANVTSVAVNCADIPLFTIGGTINGLNGVVVLQNVGGNDLTITENGLFTFGAAMPDGATYIITVLTQPGGQTCAVSNGADEVSGADVADIAVTCVTDPVILPEGELIGCFNPDLFQTGTTWTTSYRVRRYDPEFGFYDVTFGITETREVLGAASFSGEDNAVQIKVSSVGADIGAPPGGVVPLSTEPENFTGEFIAYYTVDLVLGEVRYLGAERDFGGGDGYEPWELADPYERLVFDLEPEEFVEQAFTLTTAGAARNKQTLWTYDGQGTIDVPAGTIDACRVSGVGHEPSLFVPTVPGSDFEIYFAIGTGIPAYIEYKDDTVFPQDPVMEMRLIEASIDGVPVHGPTP